MKTKNIDGLLLEEIEDYSVKIAREAGNILREHFRKPLEINFKGSNNTDPVTTADRASDEYLKKAIRDKFPQHHILSEEGGISSQHDSPFTWVLDPLDGTTNFINGLPFFAVSIGILWNSRPVAGSIHVPVSHNANEGVYHGRLGKGAFFNDERIMVTTESPKQPLSKIPAHLDGRFRLSGKGKPHDARNLGSIAVELALTACGVFQSAFFNGPKLWDVAAGILLVKEAGGVVVTCGQKSTDWTNLDEFLTESKDGKALLENLQGWSAPLIAGASHTVNDITGDIRIQSKPVSWINTLRLRSKK